MSRTVVSRWQGAILVCGKCSRRAEGGFGGKGRTPLAKVLRRLGLGGKDRMARCGVVETKCLKLCPKKAVVAVNLRGHPRWLLLPHGATDAEVAGAFAAEPALPPAAGTQAQPAGTGSSTSDGSAPN